MFLAIYPITRQLLGPVWNFVLFLSLMALVITGQLLIRRYVSLPRIGYVRPRLLLSLRLILVVNIVLVLITFGLVILTLLRPGSGTESNAPAEPASPRSYLVELVALLVMGGLFSGLGYLFGVRRMYFYGWMVGLAYLASVYMVHNAGWIFLIPLAIAAGIIIIIGLVLLARFLRKYSPPEKGF